MTTTDLPINSKATFEVNADPDPAKRIVRINGEDVTKFVKNLQINAGSAQPTTMIVELTGREGANISGEGIVYVKVKADEAMGPVVWLSSLDMAAVEAEALRRQEWDGVSIIHALKEILMEAALEHQSGTSQEVRGVDDGRHAPDHS